jgi:predicted RNA binding protein YcfA (HicA-like mRNA interferase family)
MRLSGINHLDAVRALGKVGFVVKRQGKHIILSNRERILVIPRNNPIKPATMGSIIKASGLTIEEFKKLL